MDATGISHIAICVRDLDKSLAFYRDILGMRVAADRIQDTTTGGLPYVYKHPRKTRRQVRLMRNFALHEKQIHCKVNLNLSRPQIGRVLGVVESVRGGVVDRHRNCLGGRIGGISGVNSHRFNFHHFSP